MWNEARMKYGRMRTTIMEKNGEGILYNRLIYWKMRMFLLSVINQMQMAQKGIYQIQTDTKFVIWYF